LAKRAHRYDTPPFVFAIRYDIPNTLGMANNPPLSTKQVAEELSVDRSIISRMVKAGEIKPIVRGEGIRGAMFFTLAEVRRVKRLRDGERAA
jgi:hypothetical protein